MGAKLRFDAGRWLNAGGRTCCIHSADCQGIRRAARDCQPRFYTAGFSCGPYGLYCDRLFSFVISRVSYLTVERNEMKVFAYAAKKAKSSLEPFEYETKA